MKKIPAGQFKTKCLAIMDRVQKTGESVLITKDPSDRLIGSTAIVEGMPLVTADEKIRNSRIVECIW